LEKQMRVLKLSMTFESGLLPTIHFLEANTTHSFSELATSYTSIDISIFDTYRIQKKVSKYWTKKVSEYRISYCKLSLPILRYCIEKSKKYRTKKVSRSSVRETTSFFVTISQPS
jgi:hypothetical protein